jgi:hypothetical protein
LVKSLLFSYYCCCFPLLLFFSTLCRSSAYYGYSSLVLCSLLLLLFSTLAPLPCFYLHPQLHLPYFCVYFVVRKIPPPPFCWISCVGGHFTSSPPPPSVAVRLIGTRRAGPGQVTGSGGSGGVRCFLVSIFQLLPRSQYQMMEREGAGQTGVNNYYLFVIKTIFSF